MSCLNVVPGTTTTDCTSSINADRHGRRFAIVDNNATLAWVRWNNSDTLTTRTRSIAYRIDVNSATEAELQLLPGVGPTLAEKIHTHRGINGPFQSIEELDAVPGVGATTINTLKPWIETSSTKSLPSTSLDVDRLERKQSHRFHQLGVLALGSCNPVKGRSMSITQRSPNCYVCLG